MRSTWESSDHSSTPEPVCRSRGGGGMELERSTGTAPWTAPWSSVTSLSQQRLPLRCNPSWLAAAVAVGSASGGGTW